MTAKTCTKCGKLKPLNQFLKEKRSKTGYGARCLECGRAAGAARSARYRANNPDRVKELGRQNYQDNREARRASYERWKAKNYAALQERRAAYRDANRESLREYAREQQKRYRRDNPETAAAADRRKRENNPELYRVISAESQARRRARLAGAFVEDVDRELVWSRDGGVCHLCGLPADPSDWQLEHVVPLSQGGAHSYQNTAVSHPACNLSKQGKSVPSALGLLGAYVVRPDCCP